MHGLTITVGNADEVTDLHLPQPQRNVAAADVTADLNDTGGLADAAVADDAGGKIGPGEYFLQNLFHLFDVHLNPLLVMSH